MTFLNYRGWWYLYAYVRSVLEFQISWVDRYTLRKWYLPCSSNFPIMLQKKCHNSTQLRSNSHLDASLTVDNHLFSVYSDRWTWYIWRQDSIGTQNTAKLLRRRWSCCDRPTHEHRTAEGRIMGRGAIRTAIWQTSVLDSGGWNEILNAVFSNETIIKCTVNWTSLPSGIPASADVCAILFQLLLTCSSNSDIDKHEWNWGWFQSKCVYDADHSVPKSISKVHPCSAIRKCQALPFCMLLWSEDRHLRCREWSASLVDSSIKILLAPNNYYSTKWWHSLFIMFVIVWNTDSWLFEHLHLM